MTRSQRRAHVWAWLTLGPLIAAALFSALRAWPPIPIVDGPNTAAQRAVTADQSPAAQERRP